MLAFCSVAIEWFKVIWRVHRQLYSSSCFRRSSNCKMMQTWGCRSAAFFFVMFKMVKNEVELQILYLLSSHHCPLFSYVKILFTVSLKRSNSLFRLLIDPHDSPSRRLLRWSHPCLSSRWRPLREGGLLKTSFCLFKMWCQIFTEVDLKSISWISSPLWETSTDPLTN